MAAAAEKPLFHVILSDRDEWAAENKNDDH